MHLQLPYEIQINTLPLSDLADASAFRRHELKYLCRVWRLIHCTLTCVCTCSYVRSMMYASSARFMSILFLGASFYDILKNKRNISPRLCAIFLSVAILSSSLMTILPGFTDSYGALYLWCWIDDPDFQWGCVTFTVLAVGVELCDSDLRLKCMKYMSCMSYMCVCVRACAGPPSSFYYAEMMAATVALLVVTLLPLNQWSKLRQNSDTKQLAIRMMLFPIVWLAFRLPAIINRGFVHAFSVS